MIASVLEAKRKAIETGDLEKRLVALESRGRTMANSLERRLAKAERDSQADEIATGCICS